MRYVQLGRNGPQVSRLGFGCMRLPMNSEGRVDRGVAIPMLRRAVELGINYFDTAIFYGNGDSQRALGEAMEGLRDRVILSTKNHLYEAPDDVWWSRLEESLELLRTRCIDCYNFHGMTWETYRKHLAGPSGKLRLMERAKSRGMIRYVCCSFHDSPEALVKLAETGSFQAITLQYNLLNRSLEKALYRVAELGVGVVVMGPVGGGRLGVPSERIRELTGGAAASTPEAALRFVLAHPAVCVALSGMSSMAMLQENVRVVSEKGPFEPDQVAAIDREMSRVREKLGVACTACGYCLPCPFGVDIPGNFRVFNDYRIFGLAENAQREYAGLVQSASACTECGTCLKKCPQKIPIPSALRRAMAELDKAYGEFGSILSIRGVDSDAIQAHLTVKNLRPEPIQPHVHVELADGCSGEPAAIDFREVKAFGSRSHALRIHAPDGVGALRGRCLTLHNGEARETPVHLPFFIVPRGSFRSHAAQLTAKDFGGRQDIPDTHGYRVSLRHDGERISAQLEVRSAMQGLSRRGEAGGGRLELYIDMRPLELVTNSYEDGTEQFFLCLGAPEYGTKSGRTYTLNLATERTGDGCRVCLELPFAEFLKPQWGRPESIGLDWMFVAADANGLELGHPTYGGRQGLWQNPRLFTRAFLLQS